MKEHDKRVISLMAVIKLAKDYEMKTIWNKKLRQLLEKKRKKNEGFQHQSKLVH